jgi:hypothetical protein
MISIKVVLHYTLLPPFPGSLPEAQGPRKVAAYLPRANMTLPFKMYVWCPPSFLQSDSVAPPGLNFFATLESFERTPNRRG